MPADIPSPRRDPALTTDTATEPPVPAPPADDPTLTLAHHESTPSGSRPAPIPGYVLLEELGRGGMGVVYRGRDILAERDVAIKFILAAGYASASDVARFQTEARAIAAIEHPGVVTLHVVGEHAGRSYLCMEYCSGGSLKDRIRLGPPSPHQAAELTALLADAVQAAHERGIIHRDIKPANVLLTADGRPKLTDFGLAKRLDGSDNITASEALLGTPAYMSPEQAAGHARVLTPATDIYSLGAILYELLAGRPPFPSESAIGVLHRILNDEPTPPGRLRPGVPADLEAVCLKCLAKKPADRYPTAAALAGDIENFLAGRPVTSRSARHTRRVRPALWGAIGFGVAAPLVLAFRSPPAQNAPPSESTRDDPVVVQAQVPNPTTQLVPKGRKVVVSGAGRWRIDGKEIVQESGAGSSMVLLFGDPNWTDYDFAADVKRESGDEAAGLCFRAVDSKNFFCLARGAYQNTCQEVCRYVNGMWTRNDTLLDRRGSLEVGQWYSFRVEARGQQFRCFVDGGQVFEFTEACQPAGCVGLRAWGTTCRMRNIRVTDPHGRVLCEGLPDLPTER